MKGIDFAFLAGFIVLVILAGCGRGRSGDTSEQTPLWQSTTGLTEVHSKPPQHTDRKHTDRKHTDRKHTEMSSNGNARRVLPPGFSGSHACAKCHAERTRSFLATAHARSGRFIKDTKVTQGRTWNDVSRRRRLHAEIDEGGMKHQVTRLASNDSQISKQTAEIAYEFGSGTHAHTYAFRDGDFWCESPLSWYAGGVGWEMSPGYDTRVEPEFDRAITDRCVFCHVGAIEQSNYSPNHFEIRQAAIGCERCHGGGRDHIAYHSVNDTEGREAVDPIVNPAKLSLSASEAVCTQCHLQGDQLVVANGVDVWDYAPGESIEHNRTNFRVIGGSGNRIVGHTEQLRQSRCYTQSERLTCVTCHDPHGEEASTGAEVYRQVCAECHGNDSCGLDQGIRLATNENDCAVCHMPKQATNVVHAALHQHRIGVHAESYPPGVSSDQSLAKFEHETPQPALNAQSKNLYPLLAPVVSAERPLEPKQLDRRHALAVYSAVFNGGSGPSWEEDLAWARNRLIEQIQRNPSDRSVRTALARDYLNHGGVEQAERLLQDLVANRSIADRPGIQSLAIAAELRLMQGNSVLAKPLFQALTTLRRVSGDHYLHGLCCANTGDADGAIRSFRQALRIDPELVAAHQQLAVIHASRGQSELAESHEQAVRHARESSSMRP